jgi:hypothetical protein
MFEQPHNLCIRSGETLAMSGTAFLQQKTPRRHVVLRGEQPCPKFRGDKIHRIGEMERIALPQVQD